MQCYSQLPQIKFGVQIKFQKDIMMLTGNGIAKIRA